jgi:hypothetical protein
VLHKKPRSPLNSALKVMSIVRAVAFLWALLACVVIAYFGVRWMIDVPTNPLRNELLEGVAIGFLYGSPALLALPLLAWIGRNKHGKRVQILLLLPLLVAASFITLLVVKVGA